MKQIHVDNCVICRELCNKEPYDIHIKQICKNCKVENRILYENKNFVVIPSLGPLSDCHILVLPKHHINSFALLDKELLNSAEKLINEILIIIREKYGRCIIFEHGVLDEKMMGSASCNHAHMHIVSCNKSILPYLKKENLQIRKVEKMTELTNQRGRNKPYFYYCEDGKKSFIMDDNICKSQYIRIMIAEILQMPGKGNWKENPGILNMQKMLLDMKDVFAELNGYKENYDRKG